jgi:hypothetical protein
MALKFRIKKLEDVAEELRGLYTEKDGEFVLTVDGLEGVEDTEALRNAKQHEKAAREKAEADLKLAKKEAADLKKALEDKEDEAHREAGNVEALDNSWKEKFEKLKGEYEGRIEGLNGNLSKVLVDREAIRLASELAVEGSADVLLPHIRSRLAIDDRDGEPRTVVLGADGKPSALTVDELKTEISTNKAFAPIIVGSKAGGGGATNQQGGGGASKIDWSKASPKEKVEAIKAQQSA